MSPLIQQRVEEPNRDHIDIIHECYILGHQKQNLKTDHAWCFDALPAISLPVSAK